MRIAETPRKKSMKPPKGKILYASSYSAAEYISTSVIIGYIIWRFYGDPSEWTIKKLFFLPLILFFTYLPLSFSKLFDVYEGALVVRFPKILMFKDSIIDLHQVKKMTFKLRTGRGANHVLIVEYEGKKNKYPFWPVYGFKIQEVINHLKLQGVNVEVIKVLGWFNERVAK
jgi:hypothetical protein